MCTFVFQQPVHAPALQAKIELLNLRSKPLSQRMRILKEDDTAVEELEKLQRVKQRLDK